MIMDDPCTFVSHSLHRFVPFFMKVSIYNETFRYPDIAELAYGSDRRGCFEIPNDEDEPTCGIDCPDILPIECDDERGNLHDPLAMENPSQLVKEISKIMLIFLGGKGGEVQKMIIQIARRGGEWNKLIGVPPFLLGGRTKQSFFNLYLEENCFICECCI